MSNPASIVPDDDSAAVLALVTDVDTQPVFRISANDLRVGLRRTLDRVVDVLGQREPWFVVVVTQNSQERHARQDADPFGLRSNRRSIRLLVWTDSLDYIPFHSVDPSKSSDPWARFDARASWTEERHPPPVPHSAAISGGSVVPTRERNRMMTCGFSSGA